MSVLITIVWFTVTLYFSAWISGIILLYVIGDKEAYTFFKQYRESKEKNTNFFAFVGCWMAIGWQFSYDAEYKYYLQKNPEMKRRHLLLKLAWAFCGMAMFAAINAPIVGN